MTSRLKINLALIWFIICCITGFLSFLYSGKNQDQIQPISKTNNPKTFFAVGFDKSGKLILLVRHRTENPNETQAFTDKNGNIIHPVSYYIEKKYLVSIKQQLDNLVKENFDSPCWASITILHNDLSRKKQTVRLYIGVDDYDSWYIYSVDQKSIKPLEFGEYTLHDTAMAIVAGFNNFLILLFSGWTLLFIGNLLISARIRYLRKYKKIDT